MKNSKILHIGQPKKSVNDPINWDDKINPSVKNLRPSGIRAFFDIVAESKDCISLGVGEPDFISPEPVLESAISAIREGYTHYTANQGSFSLREKISNYLLNEYELKYDSMSEILITVGVSQGLDLALRSIIKTRDEIIFQSPSYVSYEPVIIINGGTPKKIKLSLENKFQLSPKMVSEKLTKNSKALLLNYPSNPTGASIHKENLKGIAEIANEQDMLVISDEIYAELTYGSRHIPIASLENMKERTLLLGGFSKGFAMTGWRIGYACGPPDWIAAMLKIHQYSMLCAPTISQAAAEAALEQSIGHRNYMKEKYQERREEIVDGFKKIGFECHKPEGSFYVFPKITSTGLSSTEFAHRLLKEKNIAIVPGSAFGEEGEGFIRCSYAASLSDIREAIKRVSEFVESLKV